MQPSVLDEEGDEPAPVRSLPPAMAVARALEPERPRRRQRPAPPHRQLRRQPVHAAIVDRVLQPRMLPVGAVAVVALNRHHRLRHRRRLVGPAEADHPAELRVGRMHAMGHPHAAADGDGEAGQRAVLLDGDEAQVMRENIHIVVGRNRQRDLELPRQIGRSVERLLVRRLPAHALAVDPDFAIGGGAGHQMTTQRHSLAIHVGMNGRQAGERRAHHIAVHIAAGGDRVQSDLVQRADQSAQVLLPHPVKLHRLARGEAHRAAAVRLGAGIELQPLLGAALAAGQAHPHHEAEGGLQLPLPAGARGCRGRPAGRCRGI
jgi:hypothetical protein